MKKNNIFLLIAFVSVFSISYSQTKTPYEKKVDEIMIDMFTAIGVKKSLIDMAVKLNDWDIVRTSDDFSFKTKMLDRNELLIIVLASQQRLKDIENLKNDIDHRKEKEKKQNEQDIKEQELQKRINRLSDVTIIKEQIFSEFSKWMEKGEFETINDYKIRTYNKEKAIDSITYATLLKRILILQSEDSDFSETPYYFIKLNKYNPDNQFYNISIVRRILFDNSYQSLNISIQDSLKVSVDFAKYIKQKAQGGENSTNHESEIIWFSNKNVSYSKDINNWMLNSNGFIYPKKFKLFQISTNSINSDENLIKSLKLNTFDLGLSKHFPTNYIIDVEKLYLDKIDKERDALIKRGDNLYYLNELEQAKSIYLKANEMKSTEDVNLKIQKVNLKIVELKVSNLINSAKIIEIEGYESKLVIKLEKAIGLYKEANNIVFSEEVKDKILEIESNIVKIKYDELLKTANELEKTGSISKCIEKLEEANQLSYSNELSYRIIELNNSRIIALNNYKILDSIFRISSTEKIEVTKDRIDIILLNDINEDYVIKYRNCKKIVVSKIDNSWNDILSKYNKININSETWSDKNQELLDQINEFYNLVIIYSKFDINIQKAISEKNKKYLKIFRNDDANTILDEIINSN